MIITGNGQGGSTTPGAVTSVANSDGTLTVSPGTGAVVASIALAHANIWTGLQTFNNVNGIKVENTGTGSAITLKPGGTQAATYTLPTPAGAAGSFMIGDGAGVLTWTGIADVANSGGFLSLGTTLGFSSTNAYSVLGTEGAANPDNTMTASADDSIPLTLYGHSAGQTGNFQEWYNHSGGGKALWGKISGTNGNVYANFNGASLTGTLVAGTPNALTVQAGTPIVAASTAAGLNLSLLASNAIAGSTNAGAAAGGAVAVTAGNAAQHVSGDANGGAITLTTGAGIGTGVAGNFIVKNGASTNLTMTSTTLTLGTALVLPAASAGIATLGTGTILVSTANVTASSIILVCYNTPKGGVTGILSVPSASIIAGVSFVINSTDATDSTSTVNWLIVS